MHAILYIISMAPEGQLLENIIQAVLSLSFFAFTVFGNKALCLHAHTLYYVYLFWFFYNYNIDRCLS